MTTKKALLAGLLAAVTAGVVWAAESAPADSSGHRAALIAGYRGVTLPMTGARMTFVKKGDRLDVIVVFDALMKDGAKEKVGATILQDVVVADVRKPEKLDGVGAIEVLVNPNEAQYAALALNQGEVHVSVRAPGDTKMTPMEMASFRKLFQ